MRELLFKNLTSQDKKRKDLYIKEEFERDGVRTITKRHSLYIIKGRCRFSDSNEVLKFQNSASAKRKNRHIFIYKMRDTKEKKDTFVCDVVGNVYAVMKKELYSIAFKHSFEIDFLKATNK